MHYCVHIYQQEESLRRRARCHTDSSSLTNEQDPESWSCFTAEEPERVLCSVCSLSETLWTFKTASCVSPFNWTDHSFPHSRRHRVWSVNDQSAEASSLVQFSDQPHQNQFIQVSSQNVPEDLRSHWRNLNHQKIHFSCYILWPGPKATARKIQFLL